MVAAYRKQRETEKKESDHYNLEGSVLISKGMRMLGWLSRLSN